MSVTNGDAAGAVDRLLWASRQHDAMPGDDLRWAKLEAASAEAMTAVLNNSALGPCLKQLKELAGLDEARRTGHLPPGAQKGTVVSRAQQLRSHLTFAVQALTENPSK